MKYTIENGEAFPLGASIQNDGVNFSLFSEHATGVELLLFKKANSKTPFFKVALDPKANRRFSFWHIFIKGLKPGYFYAYRVYGPNDPSKGQIFNPKKVLLDPYAKGVSIDLWSREGGIHKGNNIESSLRGAILDLNKYDWEGDKPLHRPIEETIVYEMHVGGFTKDESSKVKYKGTFKGLEKKIPYLKELGITAVEFMPVFAFDYKEILRLSPHGKPLTNYWGYSIINFFSLSDKYTSKKEILDQFDEFRNCVKALHKEGIEVILDIVFNHTNEGNHEGPMQSFKGIDNEVYYFLNPENKQYYYDYSGCGNTVNCNHPIVAKFIIDVLKFWVKEMHVDGFRFDEGSILSRGQDGKPMENPPVLWQIELCDELIGTKLFTEAWDAAGLYEVGKFSGYRWGEWNGEYRDIIRRYLNGERGMVGDVANSIAGSPQLYFHDHHKPINSVNFITSHDGFTLYDLFSYSEKHNLENGENNNDGVNDNYSKNGGVEGETDDKTINEWRLRQMKNALTLLMLSRGVPMLLMGDEVGRTQKGSNNAYCQDSEISWFNWQLLKQNKNLFSYVKKLIALRKGHSALQSRYFYGDRLNERKLPEISWHGCKLNQAPWNDINSGVLGFTIASFDESPDLHVMCNFENQKLNFEIPEIRDRDWYVYADTWQETTGKIIKKPKVFKDKFIQVGANSIIVLISE